MITNLLIIKEFKIMDFTRIKDNKMDVVVVENKDYSKLRELPEVEYELMKKQEYKDLDDYLDESDHP